MFLELIHKKTLKSSNKYVDIPKRFVDENGCFYFINLYGIRKIFACGYAHKCYNFGDKGKTAAMRRRKTRGSLDEDSQLPENEEFGTGFFI